MAAFAFELVSPEALVLTGEVEQVVVPGTEGYFTVMANHAPMMSTIKPGVVDVKMADGSSEHYYIQGGFADVSPSGLTVLAEQAQHVKELNMEELEKELQEARDAVNKADGPDAMKLAADKLHEFENGLRAVRELR